MTIRHDFSRSNIFHVFSNDFINTQFVKLGCTTISKESTKLKEIISPRETLSVKRIPPSLDSQLFWRTFSAWKFNIKGNEK